MCPNDTFQIVGHESIGALLLGGTSLDLLRIWRPTILLENIGLARSPNIIVTDGGCGSANGNFAILRYDVTGLPKKSLLITTQVTSIKALQE